MADPDTAPHTIAQSGRIGGPFRIPITGIQDGGIGPLTAREWPHEAGMGTDMNKATARLKDTCCLTNRAEEIVEVGMNKYCNDGVKRSIAERQCGGVSANEAGARYPRPGDAQLIG